MVLLTAVLGVGNAWGERNEYTDGNGVTWKYRKIGAGATCSIWPKNTNSLSGRVDIPGTVEVDGVSIKVVGIGSDAFNGCSGLTAVTIPGSVTEIGERAFSGCSGLTAIEVESGNKNYCAESGVLFTKDKATLICYPGGKPEESYTIPSSVKAIGEYAFSGCSGLKAVTLPSSVTVIGREAFRWCSGLKAVALPSSVTKIGNEAFRWCSGLTAVTIPSSVTEIGWGVFGGCSELKSIEVESGNKNYCAAGGVLFTKDKVTLICYPGGKPEESYTIPSSVTKIMTRAFSGCSGLQAVTIPGSVTEIGWSAFCYCNGLQAVTIPSSVTEIKGRAFQGCSGLTSVTIPSSVTTIGDWAFSDCSGLKEVTIPGSVTEIGILAFENCRGLTAVTFPSSVTVIRGEAFEGCSGLNAVYWLAKANCTVSFSAFDGIDSSATLYVRKGEKARIEGNRQTWWKKFDEIVEGYVVTFQDGEGNKLGEQLVQPNGTATAPTAPTKEGYIVEWQLDGEKYDFSKKVEKDITLVAVWKQNYTVTFDAKGGKPTPDAQKVVKDGTATAPTDPTKKGYTFVEWQLDGAKYDFGMKVTENITLVAVWKKKEKSTPSTPKDPKTAVESVQLATARVVQNPVGEVLELEGMERAVRVEVYSVAGARVHAEALRGEPRVVIDARGWAHGVYVVKVEASDGAKTLRVAK